jgi:hypothetical protein
MDTNNYIDDISYANLRNFRQFYLTYLEEQICYTLCSKFDGTAERRRTAE